MELDNTKEGQAKISSQSSEPVPIQTVPPEEAKPPEKPVKIQEIKPKKKPKKRVKKQNKFNSPKNKIIKIDGEDILMIPSGYEIMTEEGWKPIMMRAD